MIMSRALKTILASSIIIFFSIFLLIPACVQTQTGSDRIQNPINVSSLFEKLAIEGWLYYNQPSRGARFYVYDSNT